MDKFKKLFSCAAAVCITLLLLFLLGQLSYKKDSYAKNAEFFEDGTEYDVLFIGASHMLNAVMPMEIYEDYGICSYNWAQAGHPMPANYWVLRCAMEEKLPKLVVIDCYSMEFDIKTSGTFGLMHISMDSFPLSMTKARAILDLMDDDSISREQGGQNRNAAELFWNYSVFHDRWNSLEKDDFVPEKSYSRGAIINSSIVPGSTAESLTDKHTELNSVGVDYLRRTIEHCQDLGIDVLLTYMPFPSGEEAQMKANYARIIAEEYGIDYINFLTEDAVNYLSDMADTKGHLNISGARKISSYLGSYISSRYDIPDHREDGQAAFWDRDMVFYRQLQDEELRRQESLYCSLLMLFDAGYDVRIKINDTDIYMDPLGAALLGQLGAEGEERDILIGGGDKNMPLLSDSADLCISIMRDGQQIDSVAYNYVYDPQTNSLQQISCIR